MASEVQQAYYGWKQGEFSEEEDSQGTSVSQMLDHGSISFGRFAVESLSWEKRSVFTYNERQAELEKFKSPGLVAQKKAYFEEYYKKIRALKVMQENQQTELSLEYGADGSISSQTGDEDELALPIPTPMEKPQCISQAPPEDLTVAITFEKEFGETFEQEYVGNGSFAEATVKETIESHDSYSEVNQEEDYNGSAQVQISDTETLVHKLSTGSSEEIKPNESIQCLRWTYRIDENSKLQMESDLAPLTCSTKPTFSSQVERDFVPADNPILEKTKLSVNKTKEDPIPVPVSKEHIPSTRYLSKSVKKSKSEMIKSSMSSKNLPQKTVDKAEIDITASKKHYSKNRSSYKSSVVASHLSLTEIQNKVTIPRPVSLSKEKIRAIPASTKELILRPQSKDSNRSAPRKYNPKGKFGVQGDSKEMVPHNVVKDRGRQIKRKGHEELGKKHEVLENNHSSLERRAATGLEHLQARSVNLPSRHNPDHIRRTSHQSGGSCGDKSKKLNVSTARKYEGKGTVIEPSGNTKKQAAASQKHYMSFGVKKAIGGLSLDEKKSRQEMPKWR